LMTATPSCPEIMRLLLREDSALAFEPVSVDRLPVTVKDYLPAEMTSEQALDIHHAFLAAVDDMSVSPEHIYLRIAHASRALERIDKNLWHKAAPGYLRLADGSLPAAETRIEDPFNLLHALCGLVVASHKKITD